MGILKKSTPRKSETKVVPDNKEGLVPFVDDDLAVRTIEEAQEQSISPEGQLAVDVFQTADAFVIVAPIAGVKFSDLAITVSLTDDKDEVLTIKGQRSFQFDVDAGDYFTQECFWGGFSRSIILPESVDTSKVSASFKDGVLAVRVPKVEKMRTRMIRIKEE